MRHLFAQEIEQSQRMIATPQMQKALHLLQLPICELSSCILEELEENPILECEEENFKEDLTLRETTFSSELDQRTIVENTLPTRQTLSDILLEQSKELFDAPEQKIAEHLIGNLDERGFLTLSLEEIGALEGIDVEALEKVLEKIQEFEPVGIGARSLEESLLIQLKRRNASLLSQTIVKEHFNELIENKLPLIAKKLKKPLLAIKEAVKNEISKLNLKPGNIENTNLSLAAITPDLFIEQNESGFSIRVNDEKIPTLRLSKGYLKLLEDPAITYETKEYIRSKIVSGKWFLKNLIERQSTLFRIGEALIKKQSSYLFDQCGELAPCTMKELADELSCHESTIARAVSNKYLFCPRGLFPLRAFFTHGFTSEEGDEVSSTTVKEALLKLIKEENKQNPLSDASLSNELRKLGLPCARRTVTKYRTLYGIGSRNSRRVY